MPGLLNILELIILMQMNVLWIVGDAPAKVEAELSSDSPDAIGCVDVLSNMSSLELCGWSVAGRASACMDYESHHLSGL